MGGAGPKDGGAALLIEGSVRAKGVNMDVSFFFLRLASPTFCDCTTDSLAAKGYFDRFDQVLDPGGSFEEMAHIASLQLLAWDAATFLHED